MVKKLYPVLFVFFVAAIAYTRFQGIHWGLPYPFHPDERNMANALEQLNCSSGSWLDCLNPHFFAYGQLPLYIAFFAIKIVHVVQGTLKQSISFVEATLALRFFAAFWSVVTVFISWKIMRSLRFFKNIATLQMFFISLPIFVFIPSLIQFAHFGTTESFLMFCYTAVCYSALQYIQNSWSDEKFAFYAALVSGLAVGTKISSVVFLVVPLVLLFFISIRKRKQFAFFKLIVRALQIVITSLLISVIVSPHTILHLADFLSAFRYESSVAQGSVEVFYTRQFFYSLPIWFQSVRIFPYALGWPIFILCIAGIVGLKRNAETVFLRMAFILYFLPAALLFTKWSRFMAPVFPLMTIFAAITLLTLFKKAQNIKNRLIKYIAVASLALVLVASVIPGIAYLSIYNNEDIRFTASKWMEKNILEGTLVLSETANVVDLPVGVKPFTSFDFYSLDSDVNLQNDLVEQIEASEYIVVPSRRLFANHTCLVPSDGFTYDRCRGLEEDYPILNEYYASLFSGKLGYKKVAEFHSYPKIQIFGKTLIEFPDESAEETWTVFDHPVIRVYKKIN